LLFHFQNSPHSPLSFRRVALLDSLVVSLLLEVDLALFEVPFPISHLSYWLVALLDGLVVSLLLEADLTLFLKVLIAYLLLAWLELGHVGKVTLFNHPEHEKKPVNCQCF
jgi:hypothetical protein